MLRVVKDMAEEGLAYLVVFTLFGLPPLLACWLLWLALGFVLGVSLSF